MPASIGNLDSNQRRPRNGGEDTHRIGGKRQGDIVLKIGDTAHALALAGLHLKGGDRGAGDPSDHARVKTKLLQGGLKGRSRLSSSFQSKRKQWP